MQRPRAEKIRQVALLLPLFGLFLLLPPAVRVFALPASLWGMPVIVIYVFSIWAALIVGTAVLTRYQGGPRIAGENRTPEHHRPKQEPIS